MVTVCRTIPPTNLSCQCEAEALPELHRAHALKRALAPLCVVPDDVAVDAFSSSLRVMLSHLRFLNTSVFRSFEESLLMRWLSGVRPLRDIDLSMPASSRIDIRFWLALVAAAI